MDQTWVQGTVPSLNNNITETLVDSSEITW
jgi:hypothetical protein